MEKWPGFYCRRFQLHGNSLFQETVLQYNTSVVFQIQFFATRGPKSVGFVAIDDFEIFTEEDAARCPYQPPEANPNPTPTPETTTTTESSSGVKSCDFEENLCGWEIQPPEATFSWRKTSIAELEANGELHPEHTLDGGTDGRLKCHLFFLTELCTGHFLYTSPNTVPASRTSLVSVEATPDEKHCITFSYAIAQAGIQELVVKTGREGAEQYVWRVLAGGKPGWHIGQVPTNGRVLFEAVEGEDLAGYVVLDEVCHLKTTSHTSVKVELIQLPDCDTLPKEAAMTTTKPKSTTPGKIYLLKTDFIFSIL